MLVPFFESWKHGKNSWPPEKILSYSSLILLRHDFFCSRWKWMRFTELYEIKQTLNDILLFKINYQIIDNWFQCVDLKQPCLNDLQKVLQWKFHANCCTFLCKTIWSFREIFVSKWYAIRFSAIKRNSMIFYHLRCETGIIWWSNEKCHSKLVKPNLKILNLFIKQYANKNFIIDLIS